MSEIPAKFLPRSRGEGIQPRGDEARLRIIEAAIEIFGEHGYEGASTRKITAKAAVNLAAIPYYFGGKPGLYRAALEHVVENINSRLRPTARRVAGALANASDKDYDRELYFTLLFEIVDLWADLNIGQAGQPLNRNWRNLLMQAEIEPPADGKWLYKSTAELTLTPCTAIIGCILKNHPNDEECTLLAMAVLGQVSPFRRQSDGQIPAVGWNEVNDQRRQILKAIMRRNIRAIVNAAGDERHKS